MKKINTLKLLKKNKVFINAWLSLNNSFIAEAMGLMGWDSITIDLQHGQNNYLSSIPMLQAIKNSSSVPFARVPWNEPGIIMKMLDLGVYGIIAPMINNKEDCEKFVSYCKYPPLGQRSFGPMRAQLEYGSNYYKDANNNIIAMAMIETKEAVENIDEILSVKNLDGIYVGPGDLSSSYGLTPGFDVTNKLVYGKIEYIVQKAKQYNKIAGIHNGTTKYAQKMIKIGFRFVTISSDFRSMNTHAQSIVDEMKDISNQKITNTY